MKILKFKTIFFKFLIVFLLLLSTFYFLLSDSALAVSWLPLVPCGTSANPTPCNQCDLFKLLKNIIDFILMGLMPPAAAILFVWGGFLIIMGGANPGLISKGKTIFWNTAIGVAIISASWLITNSIIRSIGVETVTVNGVVKNVASEWWKFECRVTTSGQQSPGQQPGTGQPPAQQQAILTITTSSLSDARQDFSYSQIVQATGGSAPYNWSISGSAQLPSGLFINGSTGEIFGKPTTSGNFTFTVGIQDSSSPVKSATKQLSIKVVAPAASVIISNITASNITNTSVVITWTTDKPSTSQVAYGTTTAYGSSSSLVTSQVTSHSVTVTGLSPGTTYNYETISAITGFTAISSNNTFKTTGTSVQPISITTASLAGATQNQTYSQTLSATGGTTPYSWSISSGTLSTGLNLNSSSGVISGTPTTAGTSTFTVKVTDNFTPQQSATKPLSIVVATGTLTCGQPWEQNLCQARSMSCSASACSQYVTAINQNAGGAASANFLKAVMIKESACNISADSGHAYGLMQLVPSTANIYKSRCGVTENITSTWLKTPANASASICIAAEYIRALSSTSCGNTTRNIAAGYNGGSGACDKSVSCAGETSCDGSPVKKWECLYDDIAHTICNEARPNNYKETRDYATKVLYCYNNPGF